MNEDAARAERDVVAGVEAVPESTEEEDDDGAVYAIVDDVSQPVRRRTIPVVEQLLQARRKLRQEMEMNDN